MVAIRLHDARSTLRCPGMTKRPSPPATKDDIQMLMGEIGKLYDANERWKDEILGTNQQRKEEIKRHFDLTVETIRHDLQGANRDRIENHEDRIVRIEQRLKIVA